MAWSSSIAIIITILGSCGLAVMASLDTLPVELLDNIIDLLNFKDKLALSKVSSRFRGLIGPPLELPTLKVVILGKTVRLVAPPLDRLVAKHFLSYHEFATSSRRANAMPDQVRCYRSFDFPPVSQYSFFAMAKIGHLEISLLHATNIDEDILKHFSGLLAGCVVEKMTIACHWQQRTNLDSLPEVAATAHVRHIDFVLHNLDTSQIVAPCLHDVLVASLVRVGIKEITFSGGRFISMYQPKLKKENFDPAHAFNFLLTLFAAGIESVNVQSQLDFTMKYELDVLIKILVKRGKHARLRLDVQSDAALGCMKMGPEDNGIIVNVAASTIGDYNRVITIEYKGVDAN